MMMMRVRSIDTGWPQRDLINVLRENSTFPTDDM